MEIKPVVKPPGPDQSAGEAREAFLQALEEDLVVVLPSGHQGQPASAEESTTTTMKTETSGCPSFSKAIGLLPHVRAEHDTIRDILEECPNDDEFSCMKMFLCALRFYPYATVQELNNLHGKLKGGADEPKEQVRIFCYSRLSTQQKSCLQYLTAFLEEKTIARTSLVRRWVAEGLVAKEHEMTPEEVGERCFSELVFRGFVRPVSISDAGTVKSCDISCSLREFIIRIAKSENFVSELPSHLERQIQIRKIVLRKRPQQQEAGGWRNVRDLCCGGGGGFSESEVPPGDPVARDRTAPSDFEDPMDELAYFLKSLPEVYRLNVLDLGGCQGLKKRHIKSICRVVSLKYLSLRKTDVTRLRAHHIQSLRLLETLDIRETKIPPGDMKHIFLPKLKHLLAGSYTGGGADGGTEEPLSAVEVPRRIGMMRHMETLLNVQVSHKGTELEGVAKLPQLRKLGVVVPVNENTTKYLSRIISDVVGLRSLSIWATNGQTLDISMESITSFSPSNLVLENLDINGKCNSLPPWIDQVKRLPNITLRDTDVKGDLLGKLGKVQGLRCLRLLGNSYIDQNSLNFKGGQFKALKFLVVDGDNITSIGFEDTAAPMLEKIVWTIRVDKERDLISGIKYLPNLKVIELKGDDFDPTQLSTLKQAITKHPNQPKFRYWPRGKLFEGAGDVVIAAVEE